MDKNFVARSQVMLNGFASGWSLVPADQKSGSTDELEMERNGERVLISFDPAFSKVTAAWAKNGFMELGQKRDVMRYMSKSV